MNGDDTDPGGWVDHEHETHDHTPHSTAAHEPPPPDDDDASHAHHLAADAIQHDDDVDSAGDDPQRPSTLGASPVGSPADTDQYREDATEGSPPGAPVVFDPGHTLF